MGLRDRIRETESRREKRKSRLLDLRDEREGVVLKIERLSKRREEVKDEEKRDVLHEEIADLRERRQFLNERILEVESKLAAAVKTLKKLRRRLRRKSSKYYLSPNFSVEEFHCRDGTHVPDAALPALQDWCNRYGERLRSRFGSVHVNSGYRTIAYNASIGGASNSVHIYDRHPNAAAVDTSCERGTPSEWASHLEAVADGLGRYSTFVHSDNRNRIGWADSRWSG